MSSRQYVLQRFLVEKDPRVVPYYRIESVGDYAVTSGYWWVKQHWSQLQCHSERLYSIRHPLPLDSLTFLYALMDASS